MLTVACALKPSRDYDAEYVVRLREGVKRHLNEPHAFLCMTDARVPGVQTFQLEHDWPGWWIKMELFRLKPPVLYFDLDTIPVGDLSDIAAHAQASRFTMLRDFYREKGFGSGMMSWSMPMHDIYERFAQAPLDAMQRYLGGGDQRYLEDQDLEPNTWQAALPGQVVSYKVHVRDRGLSENARVVCFHGRPRPRDIGWNV